MSVVREIISLGVSAVNYTPKGTALLVKMIELVTLFMISDMTTFCCKKSFLPKLFFGSQSPC